jgi:hypothetical protein
MTLGKILFMLAAVFCFLVVVFALAAVFLPEFRSSGATIAGMLLGALTAFTSVILGGIVAEKARTGGDKGGPDD